MHAELENWNNGWHGLRLSLKSAEVARLIQLLQQLQEDPGQHFHISSDYAAASGLGDIEVSVAGPEEPDNLWLSGLALGSGMELPPAGA
jgi:hypothetical protein